MVHGDGQISEAELAAFADGSLSPRRRAQIAACIERSPELRHLRRGEQTVVTWLRAGHACVLSGTRLSRDELLELAARNGSMDIARIHTGLSPTSPHELAA